MSKIDVLLITPPSRIDIYQSLSKDFAAIEPPVWSLLTANYLEERNISVKVLDAEAEGFNYIETSKKN